MGEETPYWGFNSLDDYCADGKVFATVVKSESIVPLLGFRNN